MLPDADFGWVRGEFTVTQNPGSAITPFLMIEGRTGYVMEATLSQVLNQNCNQFNSTSTQNFGLVFGRTSPSRSGQLSRTTCAGTFPVACCAPKLVTPVE